MSGNSVIERIEGPTLALRGADVDTDRIMPARFLKAVTFEGLERHLFADDREAARKRGEQHPLDAPLAAGAVILLANQNFGCGSSREHAPQALYRWGFRAVIAESFAEIFAGNARTIGLPCVTASPEVIASLMETAGAQAVVDLRAGRVESNGSTWPIHLSEADRQAWLTGEWDATGLLLANYDEVERVEARLPYLRTTSRNA